MVIFVKLREIWETQVLCTHELPFAPEAVSVGGNKRHWDEMHAAYNC